MANLEDETRDALLEAIKAQAGKTAHEPYLKDLAAAFALTVGAKWGDLPGGGIDVSVSK